MFVRLACVLACLAVAAGCNDSNRDAMMIDEPQATTGLGDGGDADAAALGDAGAHGGRDSEAQGPERGDTTAPDSSDDCTAQDEPCTASPPCGNGVREGDEACDDGEDNGRPARCDAACAFVCSGQCPLRVDLGVETSGDGHTWATAFASLQDAVQTAIANGGGELWVASGTYTGSGEPEVPVLHIPRPQTGRIELYGGFGGFEARRDERDPQARPTTLDGEGVAYHVINGQGDFVLDGFVITGGNANGPIDDSGGGLLVVDGSPELRNCVFRDNRAYVHGGAIFIGWDNFPTIEDCVFEGNRAEGAPGAYGGALAARGAISTPVVVRNTSFAQNYATTHGGAIYFGASEGAGTYELEHVHVDDSTGDAPNASGGAVYLATGTLSAEDLDCVGQSAAGGCLGTAIGTTATVRASRLGGSATIQGGAVHNRGTFTLVDSTLSDTEAAAEGAAIATASGATTYVYNSVFDHTLGGAATQAITSHGTLAVSSCTFLESSEGGEAVHVADDAASTTVTNSVFWQVTPPSVATFSCGAGLSGSGNVPLTASPFDADTALLGDDSPCRDAGDAAAAEAIGLDWQQLTTQPSGCLDTPPLDIGAHFPVADDASACR